MKIYEFRSLFHWSLSLRLKINNILSLMSMYGAVCFQFTDFPCDHWENIYTLSYYHHQIGSMDIIHCIMMTSQWAWWRLRSPASRLFTQPFIRAQIKQNFKAPRHWPLCGEFTGTGQFPAQKASNAENVSIWWRHHGSGLGHETMVRAVCLPIFLLVQTMAWRRTGDKPLFEPMMLSLLTYSKFTKSW